MSLLKRLHANSTDYSDGTDTRSPLNKRMSLTENDIHAQEGGGLCCNGSPKIAISADIPTDARTWTESILSPLRINQKFDISFSSYDIFGRKEEENTRPDPRHRANLGCFQIVVKSLMDFEASSVDSLTSQQIEESYKKLKSIKQCQDIQEWLDIDYMHTCTSKTDLTEMCIRILERVHQFMSQLLYMVKKRENRKSLSGGMFLQLFARYAKIFGLEVMCVPNVQDYELKIGSTTVTAEPDAIVIDPVHENAVIAVIQMSNEDDQTVRNYPRNFQANHIRSDLKHVKGQHLAQMLAVLPESAFNCKFSKPKRLYGFIIHGTEITVTSLSLLNNGFLDDLKEGCLPQENCAEMKYSTSCNILTQQGRLGLLSTLVEMSASQYML
ncbi:uncharacterized protein LOC143062641 [Mytilus galloprovincialis]|uniref:uncharacterized protein LOC143062641 n=1 Tax=Mytilus galloprovincialis TaxID=29158 RepID=UPI003F7B7F35